MELALETTQRLVADHRTALEAAARRDRLVKGRIRGSRRARGWHLGRRSPATAASLLACPGRAAV